MIVETLGGETVPLEAGRRRVEDFSDERAFEAYEALFETPIGRSAEMERRIGSR